MKIAMLSTGEEVLHGDIVDTNAAWLAEQLFAHGFGLDYRMTVGDGLDSLSQTLLKMSQDCDVVIVNGGLGPTTDDVSAQASANAAGESLRLEESWVLRMQEYFAQYNREMPPSNIKQAMIPQSAEMIDNPVGTACGFNHKIGQTNFIYTPGVPSEFKRMTQDYILPYLKSRFSQANGQECFKIYTIGAGESALAELLEPIVLPDGVFLGYRSYVPYIEIKLFTPTGFADKAQILEKMRTQIAPFIVSEQQDLLSHLGALLEKRKVRLSFIDKATGGELGYVLNQNEYISDTLVQGIMLSDQRVSNIDRALKIAQKHALNPEDKLCQVGCFIEENNKVVFTLRYKNESLALHLCLTRELNRSRRRSLLTVLLLDFLRRYFEEVELIPDYLWFDKENCKLVKV